MYENYKVDIPFEYYFLDDAFNETFAEQTRLSMIFTVFTSITLFIACMGLFGLITFMAETRVKEIGIRKILGASVFNITSLLSKDFLILVLVSILIASPIAYSIMNKWLADFAFKIEIEWWVFVLAGVIAVGIALFPISFQSIKAAVANPVDSLRSE